MSQEKSNGITYSDIDRQSELPNPACWHAISRLSDGTRIGRVGSYWYILNYNDRAVSEGYHEVYCDENGDYRGQRGTQTEQIVLYADPHHSPTHSKSLL